MVFDLAEAVWRAHIIKRSIPMLVLCARFLLYAKNNVQLKCFLWRNTVEQNMGFIKVRCEICGGEDCAGVALSRLRLLYGYGSTHDGERVELTVCGNCADNLFNLIHKERV